MCMQLTNEYIRGLVEGEGYFTFQKDFSHKLSGRKFPTFYLIMHERDEDLIKGVRDHLGIRKNQRILYGPYKYKDGINRGAYAKLAVRDFGQMKNIIIPFFYKKLKGYKGRQFAEWLEEMGSDPMMNDGAKLLFKLYKSGYWDKNPKF